MSATKDLVALFAIGGLLGCTASVSLPPPAAESPRSTGIAISVTNIAPMSIGSPPTPDRVYFMKLDEQHQSEFTKGELLPSNYVEDRYVYLLNAEPGRYVAVASTRAQSGFGPLIGETHYKTYFPEDMIKLTEIMVEPGNLAYMGTFSLKQTLGLDGADKTQIYFYRMLAPGDERESSQGSYSSGKWNYRGSLQEAVQSEGEQAVFREHAQEVLAEVGWGGIVR